MSETPDFTELTNTAIQFTRWVTSVAPGAKVFVCGGYALQAMGSLRVTTDVDVVMDLRNAYRLNSSRTYNTNSLKDLAADDPEHFIAGLKIYWKLTQGKNVQVDFVDATQFWNPFHDYMGGSGPVSGLSFLTPPTLLVGKMLSATERDQSNPRERMQKQTNDIVDLIFLLDICISNRFKLTQAHLEQLRSTATVQAFAEMGALQYMANSNPNIASWGGK